MPVGEMLSRMSSAELTEWLAYFALEREPKKPDVKAIRASLQHLVRKNNE
jgi:LPS sulfotransferase NodH